MNFDDDNGLLPRRDQKQLLVAGLVAGDEALSAWQSWRAANDPQAIDRSSRRLLPLVYRNLRDAGLSSADSETLRDVYAEMRALVEQKLAGAKRVVEAFVAAGIDVLILKGAALARFYDGDPALRPMRDLDLLVRPDDRPKATLLLGELGYAPGDICGACVERYATWVSPSWPFLAPDAPDIDLHWHTLHESRTPEADEDFWRSAVPLDYRGVGVKALCATDQLLHACIHGLQREPYPNLRWIADALAILRQDAEPIDWERLLDAAARRGVVPHLRYCFDYLTKSFAAPIPEPALEAVRRLPSTWLERAEFDARFRLEGRSALTYAVLAHQHEARQRRVRPFARALPWHLWGAQGWWQMPAWSVLDRLRLAPRPGSRLARRLYAPPPEVTGPANPPAYRLGEWLRFGRDGNGLAALGSGWSYAEAVGVWSHGAIARLALELPDLPPCPLSLEVELAAAWVVESHPSLDVHVLVDGSRIARWPLHIPLTGAVRLEATIPAGLVPPSRRCTIDFRILRPRPPASLGLSADQRPLGIHLSALRLGPVA